MPVTQLKPRHLTSQAISEKSVRLGQSSQFLSPHRISQTCNLLLFNKLKIQTAWFDWEKGGKIWTHRRYSIDLQNCYNFFFARLFNMTDSSCCIMSNLISFCTQTHNHTARYPIFILIYLEHGIFLWQNIIHVLLVDNIHNRSRQLLTYWIQNRLKEK